MSITSNGIMTSTNKIRKHSPSEAPVTSCLLHEMFGTVSGHLLLVALIYSAIGNAEGVFVQTPTDAIVMVNDSTIFNCSSNDTSTKLTWYHYAAVGKRSHDVYDDKIKPSYEGRFDIASGTYNLLVQRPESNDAGKYECKEDPLETGTSAELTILDSELRCEANRVFHEAVALMHCGQVIDSDKSLLSCSVSYNGNIEPRMTWNINERESNETECNNIDKRAVCNAKLETNLIRDGSVFTCQITTAEQYACSLKVSKTIHSVRNITVMEDAFCFANISDELQCEIKWVKDGTTVQMGEKLTLNATGQYKCEVECTIRNKTCAFTAMEVNALHSDEQRNNVSNASYVGIVIGVIGFGIVLFVVVLLVIKCRRTRTSVPEPVDITISDNGLTEARELLQHPHREPVTPVDYRNCNITNFFNVARHMYEGINGNVYGPGVHEGIKCAFQEILCPNGTKSVYLNVHKWKKLENKNLIKYYGVIENPRSVYVAMEYTIGGTVREVLREYTLSMKEIKDWSMQIAQGMEYLHTEAIVSEHGRLSTNQIFILESSGVPEKTLKIGCFNFREIHPSDGRSIQQISSFSSPEKCKGEDCSEESDVWSFGIVIWEVLTRIVPYKKVWPHVVSNDIIKGATLLAIPDSCPENEVLVEIIKECRSTDPSQRKSFGEIIQRLKEWQV